MTLKDLLIVVVIGFALMQVTQTGNDIGRLPLLVTLSLPGKLLEILPVTGEYSWLKKVYPVILVSFFHR